MELIITGKTTIRCLQEGCTRKASAFQTVKRGPRDSFAFMLVAEASASDIVQALQSTICAHCALEQLEKGKELPKLISLPFALQRLRAISQLIRNPALCRLPSELYQKQKSKEDERARLERPNRREAAKKRAEQEKLRRQKAAKKRAEQAKLRRQEAVKAAVRKRSEVDYKADSFRKEEKPEKPVAAKPLPAPKPIPGSRANIDGEYLYLKRPMHVERAIFDTKHAERASFDPMQVDSSPYLPLTLFKAADAYYEKADRFYDEAEFWSKEAKERLARMRDMKDARVRSTFESEYKACEENSDSYYDACAVYGEAAEQLIFFSGVLALMHASASARTSRIDEMAVSEEKSARKRPQQQPEANSELRC